MQSASLLFSSKGDEPRQAILLVNVGTPDSSSISDVRRYLRQFLSDARVVSLPWLARQLLVNAVIVPFRASKSANLYRQLWTPEGSPLFVNALALRDALNVKFNGAADVFVAMRYGNPAIDDVLAQISEQNYSELIVVPLFPHYASSTTGTAVAEVMRWLRQQDVVVPVRFVGQFFNHKAFVGAVVQRIAEHHVETYDHLLFSYHGLPVKHVERTHPGFACQQLNCTLQYGSANRYCYHAACYETSRLIARELNLSEDQYSVAFQSRLGHQWLEPYSDQTIQSLARKGVKKLLVVSPAFVADCLETTVEIGIEYRDLFISSGGEVLTLVESLNDSSLWVNALHQLISESN